jgi:ABC-type Fe3+ transport system permease subunit
MSKKKRWRPPRKKGALRNKILMFACLLLVPTILGGACGTVQYLIPRTRTFGVDQPADENRTATAPTLQRQSLTGAVTGGVLGIVACGVAAWATRPKKKKW